MRIISNKVEYHHLDMVLITNSNNNKTIIIKIQESLIIKIKEI
jgi:hypothetical protein